MCLNLFVFAYNKFQVCNMPEFSSGFIVVWKEHNCLSKVKDKSYPNKNRWDKAYQLSLDCYKQYDSSATKDLDLSKINNLWSAFRKEFFL
jgi:hypothetical protein